MRPALAFAALASTLTASAAMAQPAGGPPPSPPRLFSGAGYSEPLIPAAACRAVNAAEARCAVPAMTAGTYLVRAAGVSTAFTASAAQQLTIAAGDKSCTSTRRPAKDAPWPSGQTRTFRSACLFTIVTDSPLTIEVAYLDQNAVKDPSGPQVSITPMPWSGALGAMPVQVPQ
jgi:hypothetical protein